MTYCEQTDIYEYALHLSSDQLSALTRSLAGTTDPHLQKVLKAIRAEKYPVNKAGFERRREIKLCPKCGGSGKIRVGNLRSNDYDFDDCPFCYGAGSIIEISTVTRERLTPYFRNEFAK